MIEFEDRFSGEFGLLNGRAVLRRLGCEAESMASLVARAQEVLMSGTAGGGESGEEPWLTRTRRWFGAAMPFRASRAEMGPWEQKEALRARITELEAILDAAAVRALACEDRRDVADSYAAKARAELEQAQSALAHDSHPRMRRAAHLGVAQSHVDAAMNLMVWMASGEDIQALLPDMLALIDEHFQSGDPRRIRAHDIARRLQHDEQGQSGLRRGSVPSSPRPSARPGAFCARRLCVSAASCRSWRQ
ncbi:hypothetical protein [Streptomyces sp. NPDC003832]